MINRLILAILCLCFYSNIICQVTSVTAAAGIEFIGVPAGKFVYGKFQPPYPVPASDKQYRGYRPKDYKCAKKLATKDSRPGFEVNIPKPFYIGKYEVTQEQWTKVMGTNPSIFKGDQLPVDNVSWYEVQKFLLKLNQLDSSHHYRLPTEFEWEYAARAGAAEDIAWDEIRLQAQLGTRTTNRIGQKKPNTWGFFDMLGNVWEWTSDIYNEKIFADVRPQKTGSWHVLKGASFVGDVKNATYMTHAAGPGNGWDVGFRVLMEDREEAYPFKENGAPKTKEQAFNGWHLSRTTHQGTTPDVQFNKGILTLKQNPYGQGGVLLSDRKYKNFELTVDVKIDSFCNGGIFLRSTESGQAYQVELSEPGGTGNLLGEMLHISRPAEAANKNVIWKPNDWNTFRIRMTGSVPRIMLWVNGELMWDVTQPENDFIAGATEGMIGFQVHWSATYSEHARAFDMSLSWRPDGKHQFRNIKIVELK